MKGIIKSHYSEENTVNNVLKKPGKCVLNQWGYREREELLYDIFAFTKISLK